MIKVTVLTFSNDLLHRDRITTHHEHLAQETPVALVLVGVVNLLKQLLHGRGVVVCQLDEAQQHIEKTEQGGWWFCFPLGCGGWQERVLSFLQINRPHNCCRDGSGDASSSVHQWKTGNGGGGGASPAGGGGGGSTGSGGAGNGGKLFIIFPLHLGFTRYSVHLHASPSNARHGGMDYGFIFLFSWSVGEGGWQKEEEEEGHKWLSWC